MLAAAHCFSAAGSGLSRYGSAPGCGGCGCDGCTARVDADARDLLLDFLSGATRVGGSTRAIASPSAVTDWSVQLSCLAIGSGATGHARCKSSGAQPDTSARGITKLRSATYRFEHLKTQPTVVLRILSKILPEHFPAGTCPSISVLSRFDVLLFKFL